MADSTFKKVVKQANLTDEQAEFLKQVIVEVRKGVLNPKWPGAENTITKILDATVDGK